MQNRLFDTAMKRIILQKYLILILLFITGPASVWGQTEITFDISKGNVTFTDDTYTGVKIGETTATTGTHNANNKYIITGTATSYYIRVGKTDAFVTEDFLIYLNNVDIRRSGNSQCAFAVYNKGNSKVAVILQDHSNNILYSGKNRAGLEKGGGAEADGTLIISCEAGYEEWKMNPTRGHTTGADNHSNCTETCGHLDARSGNTWNRSSEGTYYKEQKYNAGAGIGTAGQGSGGVNVKNQAAGTNALVNLTIAGGNIEARGAWGYASGTSGGGAAIGTGSAAAQEDTSGTITGLKITGGNIKAYRIDNSAACIGGGYRSGYVNMDIYGGTIDATLTDALESITNSETYPRNFDKMRAAAIGGGGGGNTTGSPAGATVTVHNGYVKAKGQYGSAIGSGSGGNSGSGQDAEVIIYNGNIDATTDKGNGQGSGAAIGSGGSTGSGHAGKAIIEIHGGNIVAESELGADIGGGGTNSSTSSGYGGESTVTITGGTIVADNGGIGGGRANKGLGGDAEITILGENTTITARSIGGGRSKTNTGGNVMLTVNGGTLTVNDYIGGGIGGTKSDKIGWAKVYIKGGTISGRTVMKASATDGCVFDMSGGTVTSPIYDQPGGAVYMVDSKGTATLSGGTIRNCQGTKGGAIYMTGGTFTISGEGKMENNTASQNGAALYLDGTGKVFVKGGNITGSSEVNKEAIYIAGGEFTMTEGTIKDFKGSNSGAVFMEDGTFTMTNGIIDNCSGTESGAIYMSGGTFGISGGTISNSRGAKKGGAVYLGGTGTVNVSGGNITGNNVTDFGGAVYMTGGKFTISGGNMANNTAAKNGAAVYLDGTGEVLVNGGSITGTQGKNVEAIYMAGGVFTMNGGSIGNFIGEQCGAVNMADGTFTMTNGTIDKCQGTGSGAIYMSGGEFEISGGNISNCSGTNGGALYMADGTFSISGNAVMQSNSSTNGGSVYLAGTGTLNIGGGTIKENVAAAHGGAIYLTDGTFNMTAGKVEANTSQGGNGAGIYINNGTVSLTGGEVTGNEAINGKGGGFYVAGGNVTLSNGTISSNKAKTAGGGICLEGTSSASIVSMNVNGCTLTENEATEGNGGGIFLSNAEMTYNGGLLSLNKASCNQSADFITGYKADASSVKGVGGGIYISSHSKLTVGDFSTLGVYANTADMSADDLFANGDNTYLLLPNIAKMSLQNYAGNAQGLGWYEDYFKNDTSYNVSDIAKGNAQLTTFENRFRVAQGLGSTYMRLYELNEYEESRELDDCYVSLALGFLFSDLTIRVKGLVPGESCIFNVTGEKTNRSYQIPVYGTLNQSDEQKIVKLPIDTYTVTLIDNWTWAYDIPADKKNITKMNSQDGGIYLFEVEHKTPSVTHDERKVSIKLD